jgi:ribosomal protein L11 methyltransferase
MLEGPNNATFVMRVTCVPESALHIVDAIVESFDPARTAAAAFELDGSEAWGVEAYFGAAPDETRLRALIATFAGAPAAQAASFSRIKSGDWVAHSLARLAPVRVGRFLVHGEHDRDSVAAHEIGIEVEAALAFGTGQHGSTRGCLSCLDDVAKRRRPRAILDVGTGTGVLAIAAARMFHVAVKAGDIDATAVATAEANAKRNRVAAFVRPIAACGVGHPALQSGAPYDLVLANILAAPLQKLAPAIRWILAPGGEVILSGLLPRDVPGVVSAYGMQKIRLVRRLELDGWATLLMRRPFSPFAGEEHCANSPLLL